MSTHEVDEGRELVLQMLKRAVQAERVRLKLWYVHEPDMTAYKPEVVKQDP